MTDLINFCNDEISYMVCFISSKSIYLLLVGITKPTAPSPARAADVQAPLHEFPEQLQLLLRNHKEADNQQQQDGNQQ